MYVCPVNQNLEPMKEYTLDFIRELNFDVTVAYHDRLNDLMLANMGHKDPVKKLNVTAIANTNDCLRGKEALYIHRQHVLVGGHLINFLHNCDQNVNHYIILN